MPKYAVQKIDVPIDADVDLPEGAVVLKVEMKAGIIARIMRSGFYLEAWILVPKESTV